jgi:hypothetical protein
MMHNVTRRPREEPSPVVLEELVLRLVGAPASARVHTEKLKSRVYRVQYTSNGATRSFVGKRLDGPVAHRNQLVANRWLPAVGLSRLAAPLLAVAAEADGASVWHVYDDLGDHSLDERSGTCDPIRAAVSAVAQMHARFAEHALLPEVRLWGGDLGMPFYVSAVRDAIASLEWMQSSANLAPDAGQLCERLSARLIAMRDDAARRADVHTRWGGPETLLHGDLWPNNVMLIRDRSGVDVRLIDWDHAGVGPVHYDLSTFLSRFPAADRRAILARYEREVAAVGWRLPPPRVLNAIFETAELGRIASRVAWPALASWEGHGDWAVAQLQEVEQWFKRLTPLLPTEATCESS